jgi:hypothetical protein
VRNPLRDEGAAFRLVFVTIGALAMIVAASAISTWLGAAVTVVLATAGSGLVWRARRGQHEDRDAVKVIVVGDHPGGDSLAAALRSIAGDRRALIKTVPLGPDPVGDVEDALRAFAADAIVAVREVDPAVVERLRRRFVVPVTQAPPSDAG